MSDHLEAEAVDFIQFALRWVNCLLVRELPFCLAIRLWDTYLAEGTGFSEFLVRCITARNSVLGRVIDMGQRLYIYRAVGGIRTVFR